MAELLEHQKPARLQSSILAFATIAIYLVVLAWTNSRFTLIDDEANFIAAAAQPVLPLLRGYFLREGLHDLHPPGVTILLHGWLIATHYSFFALRIFANIFFVAAVYCSAKAAEKTAGKSAHWFTLLFGLTWPFAFQYGRITEWYGCSMFLLSVATWAYLGTLDDRRIGPWLVFGAAGVLLVWCSYFGFLFLFMFLADLLLFHRAVGLRRMRRVLAISAVIAVGFLPLLKPSLQNMAESSAPNAFRMSLAHNIASAGYPAFSIFGSVAVAPWFWPLSIPVFLAIILLVLSVWPSAGRRWILYFAFTMLVLELSGQMSIKRVVFLLPWLFLAMGLAASTGNARSRLQARLAIGVLLACGWVGIASGRHYATTNLHEPWAEVAKVVANDARSGATIASENPPFFIYLNYQLGLQREVGSTFANLGTDVYRAHGFNVLKSYVEPSLPGTLHGKVVLVKGPSVKEEVEAQNALNEALRALPRSRRVSRRARSRRALENAIYRERRCARLSYRCDLVRLPLRWWRIAVNHDLQSTIALLSCTPGALGALLRELPETWTHHNEGGETFTVVDVVGHLIYADRVDWMPRVHMILEFGEAKPFEPFDRRGHVEECLGKSLPQLLDEFRRVRAGCLDDLRALNLQAEQLELRGRHPSLGSVTLSNLLATWAAHDLTHLHQIARIMAHQYRDEVGPFGEFLGVLKCSAHGG